jgi:hypothetical protein
VGTNDKPEGEAPRDTATKMSLRGLVDLKKTKKALPDTASKALFTGFVSLATALADRLAPSYSAFLIPLVLISIGVAWTIKNTSK